MTGQDMPASPRDVAADWITIWQSELSALATDRETQETWRRLVTLWAESAQASLRLIPGNLGDAAAGSARAPAPAGAAAAVAALDERDAELRRLADRVAELERRLAAGEPGRSA